MYAIIKYSLKRGEYKGNTILSSSSSVNSKEIIELLIKKGANVNFSNDFNETPLSVTNNITDKTTAFEIKKILVEAGAIE